jgi:fermentation-respiration switch protein FrsA (DUF1100 family)
VRKSHHGKGRAEDEEDVDGNEVVVGMTKGKFSWRDIAMRVLTRVGLISAAVAFFALNFTAYRLAHSYMHPPRVVATGEMLRANGINFETVSLTTEDEITLRAFYVPSQNGAVILVAHGHGGTIPEDMVLLFAKHGYGVLAWDFRAHGASGGDFTSIGYYEVLDLKAALGVALAQPGVEHVGVWGGSMGAATAIRAAARYPQIEAVVADSSFDTLDGVFQVRVPYPILRPFIQFYAEMVTGINLEDVRPVDEIGKISPRSVFLIQGLDDYSIPYESAQRLFEAAGEPKFIWEGAGVGHLTMSAVYAEEYEARVIEFFDLALFGK